MEAIILAGGFGTRLQKVVKDVPKPMAPIAGRPFLELLLSDLAKKGFERIVLSLYYKADLIMDHFGSSFSGLELEYVVEKEPLGTGGAVRLAMSKCHADHVFVFNGDTFLDLDVSQAEGVWQSYKQPILIAREVEDTARYGRLLVEGGRVTGFTEKGISSTGLINAGCYILGTKQLDEWPENKSFSLEIDFFANVVGKTSIRSLVTEGVFIDIGVPEDYHYAQTKLADFI